MTDRSKQAGFTLVEVLIALFIFSLISVASMAALTQSLQGKAKLEEKMNEFATLDAARALISADMVNMILRQNRDMSGGVERYGLEGGLETLLTFTRGGRDNPGGLSPRGDVQRVSYVFENGDFIRRALAHENPDTRTPTVDRILLSGLVKADMIFHTDDQKQDVIQIPVTGSNPHPDMVELLLEFSSGDRLTQYFELRL